MIEIKSSTRQQTMAGQIKKAIKKNNRKKNRDSPGDRQQEIGGVKSKLHTCI